MSIVIFSSVISDTFSYVFSSVICDTFSCVFSCADIFSYGMILWEIISRETGESHYPWPYRFDRGMPWKEIGFDEWEKTIKID